MQNQDNLRCNHTVTCGPRQQSPPPQLPEVRQQINLDIDFSCSFTDAVVGVFILIFPFANRSNLSLQTSTGEEENGFFVISEFYFS